MTAAAVAPEKAPRTGRIRTMHMPHKLRNLELVLLVLAWVITIGAIALVELGALGRIEPTLIVLGLGLSALTLAFHVAMRFVAAQADPFILPVATVLNGLGIAGIYRIDIAEGDVGFDAVAVRQVLWTSIAVGCAIAVLVLVRNHRILQRYTYIAMFVGVILLLLPMLPGIGRTISGARVWIGVGSFTFQPGEVAKIALAVFFAGYLVTRRDSLAIVGRRFLGLQLPRARDLGPILVIWALAMSVIVFQRDLGTALLYFGLFLVMIYVATVTQLSKTVEALRDWLGTVTPEELADRLLARDWPAARPAPVGPLSQLDFAAGLGPDDAVAARAGLRWRLVEDGPDHVVLRLVGRTLRFPAFCAPALRTVLGGDPCRVGDLPLDTDADRLVLARRLLTEAVVVPA